jgi:hypothetical protein
MIRRLLLVSVFCFAASLMPAEAAQKDTLLSSDGTLYTVESVQTKNPAYSDSTYSLALTVQRGENRETVSVPGTLTEGAHGNPALGYDAPSSTLFIFWQQNLNGFLSSRLLFAAYQNGAWSEPTALDAVDYDIRRNLKIAVTRYVHVNDVAGRQTLLPQLTVHAVWWQEGGSGELARYAMLTIDGGVVIDRQFRSLADFAGLKLDSTVSSAVDEILRHPAVSTVPTRDAVDVVFGHAESGTLYRVRIKPAIDGRLRIPIGVKGQSLNRMAMPIGADATVNTVIEEDRVAFYTSSAKTMSFVLFHRGAWSDMKTVALGGSLNADAAAEALRKMVAAE